MGLTITIVAVAIISIIGLVFYGEIAEGWAKLQGDVNAQRDESTTNPPPQIGDTVCDLIINVQGDVDDKFLDFDPTSPLIIMVGITSDFLGTTDHGEITSRWLNCSPSGSLNFAPAFPSLLEIVPTIGDYTFTVNLELSNDRRTITRVSEPSFTEDVYLGTNFITVPQHWNTVHVATDIVCDEYTATISIPAHKINDKDTYSFPIPRC